jgi:Na+/H+ antiporter NhaD/arsenite permease-like protein
MIELKTIHLLMTLVFIIGYLAIIFEFYIKINKTASAILMAVGTWVLLFLEKKEKGVVFFNIDEHLGNASQIIFFLLGVMTLIELIDAHGGFRILTKVIYTRSKRKMLWIIGFISFFLSAVIDNLTTTLVMVSVLRKLVKDPKERALLCSTVVIASNAGGAWTPIGDVTTTMLWIKGCVTTVAVMKSLFIPSFVALLISLLLLSFQLSGKYEPIVKKHDVKAEPGSKIVLCCGVLALFFVPVFKSITHLPPFMGVLFGLGVLWLITDLMHHKYESRKHLRIPFVLTKIDTSGILFFLGILLCINSLEIIGILKYVASWLSIHISDLPVIATIIGMLSAIIDNVPLVAACIGMYSLENYPPDSHLWQMIAYCAGTGGSIMIVGSAAGVALMGLEKIDFIWYVKKISLTAFIGFLAGMVTYLLLSII